ncbi:hypothetical protein MPC1_3280002 [Methylocella tundrae]|nr:hypothetical protein MPC1_3280002 [Methylocella tundrae]
MATHKTPKSPAGDEGANHSSRMLSKERTSVMPHLTAQNSIRMRLILIPACILSLGIAAVIGVTLYGAKARIASEIDSGLTLGDHLIRYALDDLADARSGDATAQSQALSRLREGLAHVRHIKVAYAAGAAAPPFPEPGAPPKPKTAVRRRNRRDLVQPSVFDGALDRDLDRHRDADPVDRAPYAGAATPARRWPRSAGPRAVRRGGGDQDRRIAPHRRALQQARRDARALRR